MIKRTPILTIWALSLALLVLFANEMGIVFWMSLTAFAATSVYIEKNMKYLEENN